MAKKTLRNGDMVLLEAVRLHEGPDGGKGPLWSLRSDGALLYQWRQLDGKLQPATVRGHFLATTPVAKRREQPERLKELFREWAEKRDFRVTEAK